MSAMDIDAEREKIRREIEELERSLDPNAPSVEAEVSGSSLESGSDDEDLDDDSDTEVNMEVDPGGSEPVDGEGEVDVSLPQTPETCLHMNLVYQEVIQEKIEEINLLLAQNREQQEKLTWELTGTRSTKSSDSKSLPANMFLGHFMKPYFKDKTSGVGPPANSDTREKTMQGIKSFEELITIKWKSREKLLLHQSVVSDRLQRLLQPKLLKLDYLNEKREKCKDVMGRQILSKQIQETTREINDINLLPEESLLGNRLEERDWEKIANIHFEGTRSAKELRKYWQNYEHPSINKKEWSEEEIEKLKEIAARHHCQDWEGISQELGTQRTAFQCLQKFQAFNKDFKRSEWSPEEDQMLLHLVQEMRVGKHIPYCKIAYYMEGRDSAQLIYRWTKRVDPSLKRGAWTPEEDALLLKAVAKYGERDWYKIRTEVPGRNDIQCRDRYLHALHYDIKKGKWSEEEEKKLIELTEKYGVGHWAKIASELPHRSGTQCLSKWKVLVGYRRNRRKQRQASLRRKQKHLQRTSLDVSSSSEDSDLEMDLHEEIAEEAASKARKAKAAARWRVPSINLWAPTRKDLSEAKLEQLASVTLLSKGFDVNRKRRPVPGTLMDKVEPQAPVDPPAGLESSVSSSARIEAKDQLVEEGRKNPRRTKDSWRVSLAYVKCVLRRNSYALQRRNREIWRKKRFASASQTLPGRSLAPASGEGQPRCKRTKDGMWKTTLCRRLMMAVTPWAGSLVQGWALRVKTEAARKTKAEFIFKQLQTARLTSTPLFTLFIQLLRIDVDGCMKVIHKRRTRQAELLRTAVVGAGRTEQASAAQDAKAQPSVFQMASLLPGKKLIPLKAKEGPVPPSSRRALSPPRPPPKPKTVSELLREKRLREAKAKKAEQKRLLLAPRLLLPPSVIIQQPQTAVAAQAASGLPNPNASPVPYQPSPVAVSVAPALGDHTASLQEAASRSREMRTLANGGGEDSSREGSQVTGGASAAAAPPLPVPAAAAPAPAASPGPAIIKEAPGPSPASCAQGLLGSRQNLARSVPTMVVAASQPGPSALPKQILPITWVLTPQGLIPMTIVSIPNHGTPPPPPTVSPGASPNPAQAAKALSSHKVPAASGTSTPPPGAPLQGSSCSSPQDDNGGSRQSNSSAPSSVPLPPAALSLLPAPCPLAPPLLPAISLGSAQPGVPPPALLKLAPLQSQALGHALHSAPPGVVKDPPAGPGTQSRTVYTAPLPPLLREEKVSPDYSLISLEDVSAVREWAKGGPGGQAATPRTRLPDLPPFLSSLKTLSVLLLNKEALERSASTLVTPGGQEGEPVGPDWNATLLRRLVRERLQDNPAYQLLKGRFLAAFTFPAALAARPPSRVTTTLSGGRWGESSSYGEDSSSSSPSSSSEEEEEEEEEGRDAGREPSGAAAREPREAADALAEQEEAGADSTGSDQSGALGFRRSSRLQTRRRQR
ncbi:snRNA-activating protein complex subunit 4 isoform X2 [Rhineura floridana]|uniref:snRNA-activating protein complex subunit 4 isoform X2 n=1 Tax=Rhineura floridana TaxID=261503 RepID=UPI002AC85AD2|nr:snRNA-activating protein complex subunit 4 isoform X2 [Rhineura floridana]